MSPFRGVDPCISVETAAHFETLTAGVSHAAGFDPKCGYLENPRNCPHCGRLWLFRASLTTPRVYPAITFVLASSAKSGPNRRKLPRLGLGLHPAPNRSTQRPCGANTGHLGWGAITTLGSYCGLSNSPGAGVRTVCFPVHALCPSSAGVNSTPQRSSSFCTRCFSASCSSFAICCRL